MFHHTTTPRHDALLYDTKAGLLGALLPFVRSGLARGEPLMIAASAETNRLLAEELDDPPGVSVVDASDWYQEPTRTKEAYRQFADAHVEAGAPGVRIVGEPPFGGPPDENQAWCDYEAQLNQYFADVPVWLACLYDVRAHPLTVVDGALRTHPHLLRGQRRVSNSRYQAPGNAGTPAPPASPDSARVAVEELDVDEDLAAVRRVLRDVARRHGLGAEGTDALLTTASELVINALTHGHPPVRLRVHADDHGLDCEVLDAGGEPHERDREEDPTSGWGLAVAEHCSESLQLEHGSTQTTARARLSRI